MSDDKMQVIPPNTTESSQPHDQLQIAPFEAGLLNYLEEYHLPCEGIFAKIDERKVALTNFQNAIKNIQRTDRLSSAYLSKYVAAAAAGLFDAALNYLWDETIIQLRTRVSQYDLSYFYDNCVSSEERRKKLNDAADLDKITDDELIRGAHAIGLIGDIGYKHLDYIRYMRNWVSAAHPNQNQITGLQIISWLEVCVNEVITLPLSSATVEIKQLLGSIKAGIIEEAEAKEIAVFFTSLTAEQVDSLGAGLFGIFVRIDSSQESRTNITKLFPYLWPRISEKTKQGFGAKYGRFVAANDQDSRGLAHQILSHVGGLEYIPDDIKAVQLEDAINSLIRVHNAMDNFYNEPMYARQLRDLVGSHGSVPKQVAYKYVNSIVYVYMTNGNGVAWNAEPTYLKLIEKFDLQQMTMAVLSFQDADVSSRLQFKLCKDKYFELLNMLLPRATLPALRDFINFLLSHTAPPDKWRLDSVVQKKLEAVKPLLASQ